MTAMMFRSFSDQYYQIRETILSQPYIQVGEWQAMDTSKSTLHQTRELEDVVLSVPIPNSMADAQEVFKPNLPWAEDHFGERVSGWPHNPPPSHEYWPWGRNNHLHQSQGRFDHTYPERFWPKHAGGCHHAYAYTDHGGVQAVDQYGKADDDTTICNGHQGIRFHYGDLYDVVSLLLERPYTRQAYLPVFFPEDTGGSARLDARVPCTLGYHFMIRPNVDGVDELSCRYFLRSCDLVRHFRNDVYMAVRLAQWVADELNDGKLTMGRFVMFISSLHVFRGDEWRLHKEMADDASQS